MVDRPTAAASRESAPDPLVGRVINQKFKILGFIARGGMGKVYRAEQAPLGRICALKVLDPNYTGDHDPEFHKRFFLEASMTSKLRHPNTVTIFDYGTTDDGIYYMAMEYLEGYTLHRAIRQVGHLPEERAAHIARQICRSLREAHSIGVVHRDLKPANVYLLDHGDEPDFVKVLDFGLVKDVASSGEELTKAGLFMGSPKYMAPEQINGAPIDGRTDIYALGVIMYEMITGKVPFDRPKPMDILMAHASEEVPSIHEMNPAARVSPALEETILRSMAKDPNDRYRSMDEVLSALKRLGGMGGFEPSMTLDRAQEMAGEPTASRIVLGASAAMAVPLADGTARAIAAVPTLGRAVSVVSPATETHLAARKRRPYRLVVTLLGVLTVTLGLVYEKRQATSVASIDTSASGVPTPPAPGAGFLPSAGSTSIAAAPPRPASSAAVAEPHKAESGARALSEPPAARTTSSPALATAPVTGSLSASKPPAAPPRHVAGPAPSAPKPAVDCNPSYYYDVDGNKHFKPECFGR
jgi:serine/threonine-protein kinase